MNSHYKLLIGLIAGIVLGTLGHSYQDVVWRPGECFHLGIRASQDLGVLSRPD